MNRHEVTVDVYAHWGDKPPVYRVYIDDELVTERTFLWSGTDTYIREHIVVDLESGLHNVEVRPLASNTFTSRIEAKNIQVDGVASSDEFTITE
jgi:hypothetical protein